MLKIPTYHLRAFTDQITGGNPAAVCVLENWLQDTTLQLLAAENGVPETSFLLVKDNKFYLRWFTPTEEIDLCGHGTLAAAYVVFNELSQQAVTIEFIAKQTVLKVMRNKDNYTLQFPALTPVACEVPTAIVAGLGIEPLEIYRTRSYLAVLNTEKQVRALQPDMLKLAAMGCRSLIVTAPGEHCDYVLRYFVPHGRIAEDPVTGSAQCTLVPYWAKRLNKTMFHVKQLSARGGDLWCELKDNEVFITGKVLPYLQGVIKIEE
jgi:PhzF family phenazine biosynthesis protein